MKADETGFIGRWPLFMCLTAFTLYSFSFLTPSLLTTPFGGRGLWGPCEEVTDTIINKTIQHCVSNGQRGLWHLMKALFTFSLFFMLMGLLISFLDRCTSKSPSRHIGRLLYLSAGFMVLTLLVLCWITSDRDETRRYQWSFGWGFYASVIGIFLCLASGRMHRRPTIKTQEA